MPAAAVSYVWCVSTWLMMRGTCQSPRVCGGCDFMSNYLLQTHFFPSWWNTVSQRHFESLWKFSQTCCDISPDPPTAVKVLVSGTLPSKRLNKKMKPELRPSPDILVAVDVDSVKLVLEVFVLYICHVVDHFQNYKTWQDWQHQSLLWGRKMNPISTLRQLGYSAIILSTHFVCLQGWKSRILHSRYMIYKNWMNFLLWREIFYHKLMFPIQINTRYFLG